MNNRIKSNPAFVEDVDVVEPAPEVPRGSQRAPHADDADAQNEASHPGLLALARLLGRHAARADLRRARRGAVPLMEVTDWLLVTVAWIVGVLVWGIVKGLR